MKTTILPLKITFMADKRSYNSPTPPPPPPTLCHPLARLYNYQNTLLLLILSLAFALPVNAQEANPTDLCSRTAVVKNVIISEVSGKTNCADITTADLAGVTRLHFHGASLVSSLRGSNLKSGDFAGLTGLTELTLTFNEITALPADIFSGLSALTTLRLNNNQLSTLPSGIFSGLTSLTTLNLSNNPLPASLPRSLFADVPRNAITLPAGTTVDYIPTTVGSLADITDFVAMGSPRVVDVANKFSDTGDALTFTAISWDTDIATVGVANDSEVTVTPLAVGGTTTITVTATDRAGQTAEQTFTVTVNATPTSVGTMDNITDLVENGTPRNVDVATHFSDTDALTFTAISDNTAIATVAVMGSVVTITPVAVGTTTITVTATDTAGQTVEQTFSVAVTNPAPTATGTIDNITDLVENGTPQTVEVATHFSDTDALTFTVASDNTAIATVTVMGSVVTITPKARGTATITVIATDVASQTAEQTFSVSVTNLAPTATDTMDNMTDLVANGSPRDVNVATNFNDPNDTLTFTATSDNTAIATVTVMGSVVTITPKARGTATITVTATDTAGQPAEQTFSVTVQADDVPTGTAGVEEMDVSVSPNPLKDGDRVTITVASEGVYRLFGISGNVLTKGTLTKGDNAVALPFLTKGIYLLKIQTTHGRMTRKVVKN